MGPVKFGNPAIIGAKRGGTREQCSQKLFEMAEIFGKIKRVLQELLIYLMYTEKNSQMEFKSLKLFSNSKYFLAHLAFFFDLATPL